MTRCCTELPRSALLLRTLAWRAGWGPAWVVAAEGRFKTFEKEGREAAAVKQAAMVRERVTWCVERQRGSNLPWLYLGSTFACNQ